MNITESRKVLTTKHVEMELNLPYFGFDTQKNIVHLSGEYDSYLKLTGVYVTIITKLSLNNYPKVEAYKLYCVDNVTTAPQNHLPLYDILQRYFLKATPENWAEAINDLVKFLK